MSDYSIKVMANLRRPTTKLTILELLWHFHEARCSDPKDRIAALFGLVSKEHRFHLDYTAHWTELYKHVVLGILKFGNNDARFQVLFHLFEFGAITLQEGIVYPSWVPNWTQSRRRTLPFYSNVRNPDTYEVYPTSPGHSEKASVVFQYDALQVHWAMSSSRLRARKVIYATKVDSAPGNGCIGAVDVLKTLKKLFPCTSCSASELFALSSLVGKIVEFRHSSRDQRSECSSFDTYVGSFSQELPNPTERVFDSLRKLPSLLQEVCLFKLESIGPNSRTKEAYGIGTLQIQVGDIMIPLWSPKMRPDRYSDSLHQEETVLHMRTMLAVRRIREQHPQHSTGIPNDVCQPETGSIIGSALCVLVEVQRDENHDCGRPVYSDLEDCTDSEQQCSMRLI